MLLIWVASNTEPHCKSLSYGQLLQLYYVLSLCLRIGQSDIFFVKLFRGPISSSKNQSCFLHLPWEQAHCDDFSFGFGAINRALLLTLVILYLLAYKLHTKFQDNAPTVQPLLRYEKGVCTFSHEDALTCNLCKMLY